MTSLDWITGTFGLIACMIGAVGLICLGVGGWDQFQDRSVLARGTETDATIEGRAVRTSRSGPQNYGAVLAWTDMQGTKRRAAVKVSGKLESEIFAPPATKLDGSLEDQRKLPPLINRSSVRIKYLDDSVMILEDAADRQLLNSRLVIAGVICIPIALAAWLIAYLASRRRQTA